MTADSLTSAGIDSTEIIATIHAHRAPTIRASASVSRELRFSAALRTIEVVATTSGSPAAVWALLADASMWARWGSWSNVEVEGGGQQEPGAVRVLVKAPFRVRERITEWAPGERMAYELIDGMRVRGYRATVTLENAAQGGAGVRWRSTYDHAGPLTALVLRLAVRDACRRLAKAASLPSPRAPRGG